MYQFSSPFLTSSVTMILFQLIYYTLKIFYLAVKSLDKKVMSHDCNALIGFHFIASIDI